MPEKRADTPPAAPAAEVAAAYDRWSVHYDSDENATRDLDAQVVRTAPLAIAEQRVVELGCGTGKNSVWLAEQARELIALDFSPGMLAVARARVRAPNVQFIQHDITQPWPVGSGAADVVIGNLVLEHVHSLAAVYAEAARVLRPGGQLFFCELHPYRQALGSQARFTEPGSTETIRVPAFQHSTSEYVNTGLDAGFSLVRVGEFGEGVPRVLTVLFTRR